MDPNPRCTKCGRALPWGLTKCPHCSEHHGYFWSLGRNTFLLFTFVLLIVMFVATGFTVKFYHAVERGLAEDWYGQGEQELKDGHPEVALTDFRNALSYSRDNPLYQLRLAQALAAAGRRQEARTYLENIWEREPGNGTVNLELARLAVREHAAPEALRYFHDAIFGEWNVNPVVQRRAARFELVDFLLDSNQKAAARSELIELETDLPPDANLETKVGRLLLKVSGYDDALRLFRQALATQPHLAPALEGAGECYFQTGQYAPALRYLERAVEQDPNWEDAGRMRDTAQAVLDLDPFNRRLGNQERAQRTLRAYAQAMERLETCAVQRGIDLKVKGTDALQTLAARASALEPRVRERNLSRDPELLSSTMDLVFEIEQTASRECGKPQGSDLALLLIAREQGGARP